MLYHINKEELLETFKSNFKSEPTDYVTCGGRIEVIGNHTDHNHGACLVATCHLLIAGYVSKRDDGEVHLISKGYREISFKVNDTKIVKKEIGSSKGIVKGVLNYLENNGYNIGGFNAVIDSEVPQGSGLSSSAAYELLIGKIVNKLFNEDKIDKLVLAKAGQYAENNYFGKKSGLLDQIGVSYGGINVIDFGNIDNPTVGRIEWPFKDLHFILVNTGGSHADLSGHYSSIPESMFTVAEHFGKKYLRDVGEKAFYEELEEEKEHGHSHFEFLDRKRAIHFFEENNRVIACLKALKEGDEKAFLEQINASQHSSQNNLCNTQVEGQYAGSPQEAIDYANAIIKDGAVRIHGGGFAGTILAFVKDNELENFITKMRARFGEDMVYELFIKD